MSVSKDKIWKLVAPLLVMAVMLLIPVPDGMPPQAWHYFAVFVAMIVGMILGLSLLRQSVLSPSLSALLAATICCLMQKSWPIRLLMRANKP